VENPIAWLVSTFESKIESPEMKWKPVSGLVDAKLWFKVVVPLFPLPLESIVGFESS